MNAKRLFIRDTLRVRLPIVLCAMCIMLCFAPNTAYAGQVQHNVANGSCTCKDPSSTYTIFGASSNGATVTIKGGSSEANAVRVTLDNVTIDQGSVKPSCAPITVESGYAVILLKGTNVLRAGYKRVSLSHDWGFAGLCVQKGATCIITSADGDGSTAGSLEAHGGHNKYGGAGIGTNYNDDTGSIYINGGTIKAYGAHSAAGIGSGRDGECHTVCIQGGDVWAWGGEYGAGIGGGDAVGTGAGGTTHDLWVHGGTVHAFGGNNGGAGIGGSEGGSTGSITITGGSITAYGCGEHGSEGSATGIGSGDGVECETITIAQGSGELTIDAKGCGEGAGIGGANCKSGTIDIKLRGGTITATGGPEAAGIGSGDDESRSISIRGNGTINAQAGWKSAAIGAGDQGHSGPLSIDGNSSRLTINAYAPKAQNSGESFVSYAAIIGAGDGSASDITINNANINLNGTAGATIEGAGIGTGSSNDLSVKDGGIQNITIRNAKIRFYGIHRMDGAGIGAGYGSNISSITLDNVDYDGPTIGSSYSDRFGTDENSMDSISIANSSIKATAQEDSGRNHAGIGTGPYGTIDSITITNSNVEARGVCGGAGIGSGGMYVNPSQALHFLTSDDGKCGSVTIAGRGTVTAIGNEGGAGIGSGTLTSVTGTISISGGTTVTAAGGTDSGGGGAGIGSGKLCSCDDIVIDGATVTATGGPGAAAIGSAGIVDTTVLSGVIQTTWNTVCGDVTVTSASKVEATGGTGAAGIGLGQGAQMESGSWITIDGGEVNATGGARGAGIGAGCESGLGRGAEARRIKILGEARVTATGGAGAAGIGGGYEGGLEQCNVSLSVNDPARAFVIAHGGVGAAGIGAGASSRHSTSKGTLDGAHDAKHLSFASGFVAAYGGDGQESSEEGRTGAGAGIGGGSYQGDLESCLISGGVVVAHAGAKASSAPSGYVDAEDIGRGGSREGDGGDGSDSIYIQGGTVVAQAVNEKNRVLVTGGSVTHRFEFDKATSSNFELVPVYQNAIAIDTTQLVPFTFDGQEFYSLGLTSTSADYFHCDDVFAIAEGKDRAKAYLYLPAGDENATTASVKPVDASLSYYGTTTANQYPNYDTNTNVLKMGAPITIVPKRRSADLVEGEPYIVRVGDLSGGLGDSDSASYTSATNATYEGYRMADDTMNRDVSHVPIYTNYASSGRTYTDVTVIPGSAGQTMKLTARLNGATEASDLYWGDGEALFEKDIVAAPIYVRITNKDDLTRLSTDPVVYPEFSTNGNITKIRCLGQLGTDYDKTVTSTDDHSYMPTDVGYYEVTVWAELNGKQATDSATFKIVDSNSLKPTSLTISDPSKVYNTKPVTPVVQCDSDGTVDVSYEKQDGTKLTEAPVDVGDYYVSASVKATVTHEAANSKTRFSITPKEGTLTLAASTGDTAGVVTVTAMLKDVYSDVSGTSITVALDSNKTATAQLDPVDDGVFTATCVFNDMEPGHYVATASYDNPNYVVNDTSTEFDIAAPQPEVQVRIVEDPTKYYDGQPVADPQVEATPNADVSYVYTSGGSSTSSTGPAEPGVYLVTATATLEDAMATDTRVFLIRKCPVDLRLDVSDKAYDGAPIKPTVTVQAKNGLDIEPNVTLTYYKKQDDDTYGDPLSAPPIEVGSYLVKANRPDDEHYRAAETDATFSIVGKPTPLLFVDMPERFVYDAEPVEDPRVWTYSDGEPKIAYYDESGNQLDGAPANAGTYSVEVSVPETETYSAAQSEKISFVVLPRPAVLAITATGDQSTEGAEVIVNMAGALSDVVGNFIGIHVAFDDVPTDALGTQDDALDTQEALDTQDDALGTQDDAPGTQDDALGTQDVSEPVLDTQGSADVQAPIVDDGNARFATHTFDHVGAGEYEVTASYVDDPNYVVSKETEHFDKRMRGYRILAEDKTVTFGDAPFAVQAEVWDTNGSEVKSPALSYSQVSSEDVSMLNDDATVLGNDGIVHVQNAGISAVRVDVAGDDTHEGNFDYAVITVKKAPLSLSVAAQNKVADGTPAKVTHSVDDASYPTPYSGDVQLTYYRENDGVRTQLDSVPIGAGTYVVTATAAGDRNYNGAVAEAAYTISAQSSPNEPAGEDEPTKPDDPDDPSDPGESNDSSSSAPSDSSKPSTPSQPTTTLAGGSVSANGRSTTTSSLPRTCDNVSIWPTAVLAVLGLVVLIGRRYSPAD